MASPWLIYSETNTRDAQYKTGAIPDHYYYQENTYKPISIWFVQKFGATFIIPIYVEDIAKNL